MDGLRRQLGMSAVKKTFGEKRWPLGRIPRGKG